MEVKLHGMMMAPTDYNELRVYYSDKKINDFANKLIEGPIVKIKLKKYPEYYKEQAENMRGANAYFTVYARKWFYEGKSGYRFELKDINFD